MRCHPSYTSRSSTVRRHANDGLATFRACSTFNTVQMENTKTNHSQFTMCWIHRHHPSTNETSTTSFIVEPFSHCCLLAMTVYRRPSPILLHEQTLFLPFLEAHSPHTLVHICYGQPARTNTSARHQNIHACNGTHTEGTGISAALVYMPLRQPIKHRNVFDPPAQRYESNIQVQIQFSIQTVES